MRTNGDRGAPRPPGAVDSIGCPLFPAACGWCPMLGRTIHHWWLASAVREATSEEASRGAAPHKVAHIVCRPEHGTRREHPRRPPFISTRDKSTRGRGMGGTGEGDRAATPPPPLGAPAGPMSMPAAAPTPSPQQGEGLATRRPKTTEHTKPKLNPPRDDGSAPPMGAGGMDTTPDQPLARAYYVEFMAGQFLAVGRSRI